MLQLFVLLSVFSIFADNKAFAGQTFYQNAHDALRQPQLVSPPASVELAFSPHGGATELVIKTIRSAKKSIHVAAYSFTSEPIADALIEAHQEGYDVAVVLDREQTERKIPAAVKSLLAANIPLRIDVVNTLQHDKFMIVDKLNVETGSFNYTFAAEAHNSENVIVLWNYPQIAAAYEDNWKQLWDEAQTFRAK